MWILESRVLIRGLRRLCCLGQRWGLGFWLIESRGGDEAVSYVCNADIEQRMGPLAYVQLTDDTGSGAADESVVTAARLEAEGEVDSYLGRRYAVPIDLLARPEAADAVTSMALDLVEYRLFARRGVVPVEVKGKREAAMRWLERAAAGEVVLPGSSELPTNPALGFAGQVVGAERVLTREAMGNL